VLSFGWRVEVVFGGDRSCWWFALRSVFEAVRAGVDEEVG